MEWSARSSLTTIRCSSPSQMIYPLMAGNTIVIKTAAQTPVSTLALGRLIQGILPKGTVNIISGGREAGDALVTHPR